jgi:hypothetical protein
MKLKMKKLILSSFILSSAMAFSQVIISGTTGTAPSNAKAGVLVEFEANLNKGIILPYVRTMQTATDLTPGTIVLDASNATKAKVKYYAPGNAKADTNGWVDLSSGNEANLTSPVNYMSTQPLSTGANPVVENSTSKAIIGANASTAKGVLVLESTTKAMLLPQVATTDDVKDPAPGMMVYVNGTNKRLAVFNGAKWTYWKP